MAAMPISARAVVKTLFQRVRRSCRMVSITCTSAALGSSSAVSSRPLRSSLTVRSNASARGSSNSTDGEPRPVSHLLTALSVTWSCAAKSPWLQFFSFRRRAISPPVAFVSMSSLLFQLYHTTKLSQRHPTLRRSLAFFRKTLIMEVLCV